MSAVHDTLVLKHAHLILSSSRAPRVRLVTHNPSNASSSARIIAGVREIRMPVADNAVELMFMEKKADGPYVPIDVEGPFTCVIRSTGPALASQLGACLDLDVEITGYVGKAPKTSADLARWVGTLLSFEEVDGRFHVLLQNHDERFFVANAHIVQLTSRHAGFGTELRVIANLAHAVQSFMLFAEFETSGYTGAVRYALHAIYADFERAPIADTSLPWSFGALVAVIDSTLHVENTGRGAGIPFSITFVEEEEAEAVVRSFPKRALARHHDGVGAAAPQAMMESAAAPPPTPYIDVSTPASRTRSHDVVPPGARITLPGFTTTLVQWKHDSTLGGKGLAMYGSALLGSVRSLMQDGTWTALTLRRVVRISASAKQSFELSGNVDMSAGGQRVGSFALNAWRQPRVAELYEIGSYDDMTISVSIVPGSKREDAVLNVLSFDALLRVENTSTHKSNAFALVSLDDASNMTLTVKDAPAPDAPIWAQYYARDLMQSDMAVRNNVHTVLVHSTPLGTTQTFALQVSYKLV